MGLRVAEAGGRLFTGGVVVQSRRPASPCNEPRLPTVRELDAAIFDCLPHPINRWGPEMPTSVLRHDRELGDIGRRRKLILAPPKGVI